MNSYGGQRYKNADYSQNFFQLLSVFFLSFAAYLHLPFTKKKHKDGIYKA